MAIGTPAGHANCFVVAVVIGIGIGIGFDCLFSFAIRAKLAAVIDSIVVVVVVVGPVVLIFASRFVGRDSVVVHQIGGKVFLFWFSFISTLYRECDSLWCGAGRRAWGELISFGTYLVQAKPPRQGSRAANIHTLKSHIKM